MFSITRFTIIVVATALAAVALPQDAPSSSAPTTNATLSMSAMPTEPTLSPCLQQCYMQASKASGCTLFDHACICPSQSFANATVACLASFCPDEIQGVLTQQSGDCASVVGADVLSSIDAAALANTGSIVPTPSATNPSGSSSQAGGASQASQTKNAAVGGRVERVGSGLVAVAVLVGLVL